MTGVRGNENLAYGRKFQTLTVDASNDTVLLPAGLEAVDLVCDQACYIVISEPGGTPVAAAPSAEKVETDGQFLAANVVTTYALPATTDAKRIKIAAIRATADGTLKVNYRSFV